MCERLALSASHARYIYIYISVAWPNNTFVNRGIRHVFSWLRLSAIYQTSSITDPRRSAAAPAPTSGSLAGWRYARRAGTQSAQEERTDSYLLCTGLQPRFAGKPDETLHVLSQLDNTQPLTAAWPKCSEKRHTTGGLWPNRK